jgi:hypothetical protein
MDRIPLTLILSASIEAYLHNKDEDQCLEKKLKMPIKLSLPPPHSFYSFSFLLELLGDETTFILLLIRYV